MSDLRFPRPYGAQPPAVTKDDLDSAYAMLLQKGRRQANAMGDKDAQQISLAGGQFSLALAHYWQLRDDAAPEVVAAHKQSRDALAA